MYLFMIYMNPLAMFDYVGTTFLRNGFVHVDNVITKRCSKQSHGCSCRGCKATNQELSGICRNHPEPSGTCLRNLPLEPTPAHTGTFRNPPEPSATSLRNLHQDSLELSGTCLWNLHQHTPEPSGTSGSSLQNLLLRRHTPELFWAEDPISLRCWATQQTILSGTLQNLSEPVSGTYTSTHRNPPEPSGPKAAQSGTLRNLPEPASGTSRTYTSTRRNPPEP